MWLKIDLHFEKFIYLTFKKHQQYVVFKINSL